MTKPTLELVLTPGGSAELRRGDEVEWCSADDDDFREHISDEFLSEDDVPEILEYLVGTEIITDAQADAIEQDGTIVESYDSESAESENGGDAEEWID